MNDQWCVIVRQQLSSWCELVNGGCDCHKIEMKDKLSIFFGETKAYGIWIYNHTLKICTHVKLEEKDKKKYNRIPTW